MEEQSYGVNPSPVASEMILVCRDGTKGTDGIHGLVMTNSGWFDHFGEPRVADYRNLLIIRTIHPSSPASVLLPSIFENLEHVAHLTTLRISDVFMDKDGGRFLPDISFPNLTTITIDIQSRFRNPRQRFLSPEAGFYMFSKNDFQLYRSFPRLSGVRINVDHRILMEAENHFDEVVDTVLRALKDFIGCIEIGVETAEGSRISDGLDWRGEFELSLVLEYHRRFGDRVEFGGVKKVSIRKPVWKERLRGKVSSFSFIRIASRWYPAIPGRNLSRVNFQITPPTLTEEYSFGHPLNSFIPSSRELEKDFVERFRRETGNINIVYVIGRDGNDRSGKSMRVVYRWHGARCFGSDLECFWWSTNTKRLPEKVFMGEGSNKFWADGDPLEGRDRIDPEARQRTILLDWALWVPEMICRAIGILLILSAAFSFFF